MESEPHQHVSRHLLRIFRTFPRPASPLVLGSTSASCQYLAFRLSSCRRRFLLKCKGNLDNQPGFPQLAQLTSQKSKQTWDTPDQWIDSFTLFNECCLCAGLSEKLKDRMLNEKDTDLGRVEFHGCQKLSIGFLAILLSPQKKKKSIICLMMMAIERSNAGPRGSKPAWDFTEGTPRTLRISWFQHSKQCASWMRDVAGKLAERKESIGWQTANVSTW